MRSSESLLNPAPPEASFRRAATRMTLGATGAPVQPCPGPRGRIPFVNAIGAAPGVAMDTAREIGMAVVGFLRGDWFNVHAGAHRVGP